MVPYSLLIDPERTWWHWSVVVQKALQVLLRCSQGARLYLICVPVARLVPVVSSLNSMTLYSGPLRIWFNYIYFIILLASGEERLFQL
jgi:hypothetical protein